MAPGEIGSFTISPMFCCSVLFVCDPSSKYVCVRATFDRFRRAQKRFYNSCVHISWRFIPAALPRVRLRKRLFFLFALSHFLACFFLCFFAYTHAHTRSLLFWNACTQREETRPEAQARKQWRRCLLLLEDALAFNRRLYHYYFLPCARRQGAKQRLAQRQ